MEQTVARLELPTNTYHTLEQIARLQGVTPLRVIEDWVQQCQQKETLRILRQEHQELIDKDLKRTLTTDEAERLDSVCDAINAIEMQSDSGKIWKQQAEAIDTQLDKLQHTLARLPERQTLRFMLLMVSLLRWFRYGQGNSRHGAVQLHELAL